MVNSGIEDQRKFQSADLVVSETSGSGGTPERTGRDQDENARVTRIANISPGDLRMTGQATMERGGMDESRMMARPASNSSGSEDAGMEQMSMMLREARVEGDPELVRPKEDLHARQQTLAERERSLKGHDEQSTKREEGHRDRRSRYTGRTGGLGARDDTDDIHIQNRR